MEDEEDEEDEEDDILEEEGEFNDIIDQQGIMVGESWLVHEFILAPEHAQKQQTEMQTLVERDRARRQQNIQNSSVSGMGRQSPYSGADGRPPMRPITPIKSSQTTREITRVH